MNKMDERIFGLSVFFGFALGGVIGAGLGAAAGNVSIGFWAGALGGVFIGWFVAAARLGRKPGNSASSKR